MTIGTKATRNTIIFKTRKKDLLKAKGKAVKMEEQRCMASYIFFPIH